MARDNEADERGLDEQPDGYDALNRHLKFGIELLGNESRTRLAEGHAAYAQEILSPGRTLGGPRLRESIVSIWSESLTEGAKRCRLALEKANPRIERANKLELASELVAAAGSSTLLGLLLDGSTDMAKARWKIAVGVVTLLGTWASVLSRFLRRAPSGENLIDVHSRLLKLAAEADAMNADLRIWHVSGGTPASKGEELAEKARALAIDIQKTCGLMGV